MAAGISEMIMPIMYIMIPVMIGKMVMDMMGGGKGGRTPTIEVPRDQGERLMQQLRKGAKFNKSGMRQVLKLSGDNIVEPMRLGFVVGGFIPESNEYIFFVRKHKWKFWQKTKPIVVDADLVTDLHGREIHIEGRRCYPLNGYMHIIPTSDKTGGIETQWNRHISAQNIRQQRMMMADIIPDIATNSLWAIRGDFTAANREVEQVGPPAMVHEDELDSMGRVRGGGVA